MAIFSNKTPTSDSEKRVGAPTLSVGAEDEAKTTEVGEIEVQKDGIAVVVSTGRRQIVALPRLSEKATKMASLNKYVFKVSSGKANKIELRKAIERFYGVKIQSMNTISVKGKYRRYGRTYGQTSGFKKVIVTLTKDSKTPDIAETA